VGQVLNWVTLMGLALIMGGTAILLFALAVAMMLAPRRRGRREPRVRPLPAPRPAHGAAPVAVSQPVISRSVLLADTLALHQLGSRPEPHPTDPVLSIITQPTGRESTGRGSPPRGPAGEEPG
jgi:uncharacterized iron-regulated membrane protein